MQILLYVFRVVVLRFEDDTRTNRPHPPQPPKAKSRFKSRSFCTISGCLQYDIQMSYSEFIDLFTDSRKEGQPALTSPVAQLGSTRSSHALRIVGSTDLTLPPSPGLVRCC